MRAVVVTRHGGPEVLEARETPMPEPERGQVLIRVAFAGVNFAELMGRSRGGAYARDLPYIPGYEVSGTIEALGEGVEGLRVGQPVAALSIFGGYAEYVVALATLTFPLDGRPQAISLEQAAAFPVNGTTAYDVLTRAGRLASGERVLVHAASGGVGAAAGQIARALGAGQILGVVSTAEKAAAAKAFGYAAVFPSATYEHDVLEATGGSGVDIALDPSGEPTRSRNRALLAVFGRLVVFGNASGAPEEPIIPGSLMGSNTAVVGYSITALTRTAPERVAESAQRVLDLMADGKLTFTVDILPLEDVAEAHRRIEARAHVGKLLLAVRPH